MQLFYFYGNNCQISVSGKTLAPVANRLFEKIGLPRVPHQAGDRDRAPMLHKPRFPRFSTIRLFGGSRFYDSMTKLIVHEYAIQETAFI